MDLLQIVVLALVQGFTEFLPISSSAHLILSPLLFGYQDQGLAFDVAVHLGTLLAVIGYFRREVVALTVGWIDSIAGRGRSSEGLLAWSILIATLPVMLFGYLLKQLVETDLRSPGVIAAATIVFGLLLWWADRNARRRRTLEQLNWRDAVWIGLAQAIALIPGTSRSGITMTAGLILGFTREAASRFSFLLAIPTISMSVALVLKDLIQAGQPIAWGDMGLGVVLSFAAALLTIHLFLRLIERMGMLPFVLYRLALGGLLLLLLNGA